MERAEKRKYHYIYKITCKITNRYYIGMHSTDNMNDGYFGSGKRLWFSINYHGKDNHVKEILEIFPTRKILKERERELVNEELLGDVMCMNLKVGGEGGYLSKEACSKGGKAVAERLKKDEKFRAEYKLRASKIMTNNLNTGKIKRCNWNGKKHSDNTKKLMSEKAKQRVGKANSQYGTCWITRDGLNKKIKKEDLEIYLKEGWIKGRN